MKPKLKRGLTAMILIIAGLLFAFIIAGCFSWKVETSLPTGSIVRIKSAPFVMSFFDSQCEISYGQKSKNGGKILLLDSRPEGPIILIPSTNNKVFFCLYEFDVELRLLKIEPETVFRMFPTNSTLSEVVIESPWQISDGDASDWHEAIQYLKHLSPNEFSQQSLSGINLLFFKICTGREALIRRVEKQIKEHS